MGKTREKIFVTSNLIGYRQWTFNGKGLRSMSMNSYIWSPGWNQAECMPFSIHRTRTHETPEIPNLWCSCGFYAHHVPMTTTAKKDQVLGVVEASGTVLVGDKGFRAEKARIVALSGVYSVDSFFRKVPGSKDQRLTSQLEVFCKENDIQFFHKPKMMTDAFPQVSLDAFGVNVSNLVSEREMAVKIWKSQKAQAVKNRSKAQSDHAKQMEVMKSAAAYVNRGMRDYDPKDPRLMDTYNFLSGIKVM